MEPISIHFGVNSSAARNWDDPTPFNFRPPRSLLYVAGAICAIVTLGWLGTIYCRRWNETTLEMIGRNLLRIPAIRQKLDAEVNKERVKESAHVLKEWEVIKDRIEASLGRHADDEFFRLRDKAYSVEEILKIFDVINRMIRENIAKKQFSGAIYPNELKEDKIVYPERAPGQSDLAYIYTVISSQAYLWNTLHKEFSPVRFPLYWAKEMVASLFGAEPHSTVGFNTTGGTGSLMQAVRMYREKGREEKGIGPGQGVIIAPKSIHAAELKGGMAYDVKFVLVDCDENNAVDMDKMKAAIDKHAKAGNLLGVFASAPNYGTGTMDPAKEIIDYSKQYDIPVHIDACLGGFVKNGRYFEWGASSVSVDPHKNGHAPKGESNLLVKNKLAKYSVYALPDWTCIYGTPKDEGSQACVNALCSFAALLYYGKEGFVKMSEKILAAKDELAAHLKKVTDIEIVGRPDANVVAFRLKIADGATYALVHEMSKRNWELNALKDNIAHICITTRIVESKDSLYQFIIALNESIEVVRQMAARGEAFPGDAGLYCSIGEALRPDTKNLPFRKYVENMLLGKKGAEETVKAHIVAQLNPYAS